MVPMYLSFTHQANLPKQDAVHLLLLDDTKYVGSHGSEKNLISKHSALKLHPFVLVAPF